MGLDTRLPMLASPDSSPKPSWTQSFKTTKDLHPESGILIDNISLAHGSCDLEFSKPKTFKAPTNLLKLWLDRQVCLPCHPPGAPCPRPRLRHQLAPLHPLLHRLSSIKLQTSACLVSIFQRQITLYSMVDGRLVSPLIID